MTKSLTSACLTLPDAERGLNQAQQKRVDNLLRLVADKTAPKHRRDQARDKLAAIEEGRRLSAEQDALDLHFAELEVLERARDPDAEAVIETARSGRRRVLTRDGLESLLQAMAITPQQYVAGMRFRDLYEATERTIRSNLNRTISGSEDKRVLGDVGQKMEARKRLEAKVQAASRNGRGLQALRLVAGEGRTVHSLAPRSGANQALYRDALTIALDVVADHWSIQ